jgi:hypothetical protein
MLQSSYSIVGAKEVQHEERAETTKKKKIEIEWGNSLTFLNEESWEREGVVDGERGGHSAASSESIGIAF